MFFEYIYNQKKRIGGKLRWIRVLLIDILVNICLTAHDGPHKFFVIDVALGIFVAVEELSNLFVSKFLA